MKKSQVKKISYSTLPAYISKDMNEILKDDYGEVNHEEEAYDNEHVDYSDGD